MLESGISNMGITAGETKKPRNQETAPYPAQEMLDSWFLGVLLYQTCAKSHIPAGPCTLGCGIWDFEHIDARRKVKSCTVPGSGYTLHLEL